MTRKEIVEALVHPFTNGAYDGFYSFSRLDEHRLIGVDMMAGGGGCILVDLRKIEAREPTSMADVAEICLDVKVDLEGVMRVGSLIGTSYSDS